MSNFFEYRGKSEEELINIVRKDPHALKYIQHPSNRVQMEAMHYPYAIQYIQNPCIELQEMAVNIDALSILYIKNPSEELKLKAVRKNGVAIANITNPSYELQLEAVKQTNHALFYIDNPSIEMEILALENKETTTIKFEDLIKRLPRAKKIISVIGFKNTLEYLKDELKRTAV